MGITIHHTIATETQLVKKTLDHAENVARVFKKQADSLGYEFNINRRGNNDLLINIQGCETLRFNFVSFDEQWPEEKDGWLNDEFRTRYGHFEQSPKTSDHYKQWPGQVTLWSQDFCKTQYGEGYICHIWVAEIIRAVAGAALLAKVHDEGDYYHTRDTADAVGAIKDNQAMIDALAGTFESLGYKVKKHD